MHEKKVNRKYKDRLFRTLFSSKKVKLPQPRFIVFYNGEKERPERWENRLSELYIRQTDTPELELTVLTLLI